MNVSATQQRAYRVRKRYGLSLAEYDAIRSGSGCCALCRVEPSRPLKLQAYRGRTFRAHPHQVDEQRPNSPGGIKGFVCWPCGTLLRLLERFPKLRTLVPSAAAFFPLSLSPPLSPPLSPSVSTNESAHASLSLLREEVKGSKSIEARIASLERDRTEAIQRGEEEGMEALRSRINAALEQLTQERKNEREKK